MVVVGLGVQRHNSLQNTEGSKMKNMGQDSYPSVVQQAWVASQALAMALVD